jgi:hypothetical protein
MRSSRWSKILWMAALLPLFAASVLPAQLRTLICRVTGAVMELETTCPAASMAQEPVVAAISDGGSATISEPGCCVVETIDLGRPLAEHGPEGAAPSSFTPVAATLTPRLVLAGRATSKERQDRPPPAGPPLLLLKRSFLI